MTEGLRGFTLLLVLQATGELLARALALPLPGPVLGLLMLWPLLEVARVRAWVAPAADLLLSHLSLLFVPVGVGVIVHLDVVAAHGVRLALVILLSTWIGIAVTALVMRALLAPGDRKERAP